MKKIFTVIFVMFFCLELSAQKINEDFFLEGNVRSGFVHEHPDKDWNKMPLIVAGGELRFGYQTRGKNKWEKEINYPILGGAIRYVNYSDLLNRQLVDPYPILGQCVALFGYIQIPMIRYKWFSWHGQIGMGAVYFTKTYDPINNPENCLISLPITPYVNFQSGFDFKLSQRFDLTINASFTHASNASLKMPNWGINETNGLIGLRYHFNKSPELPSMWKKQIDTLPKFVPTNSLFFALEPGVVWARYDDYYYFKTSYQVGYIRHTVAAFSFGASLDFTHATRLGPSEDVKPGKPGNSTGILPREWFQDASFYEGPEIVTTDMPIHVFTLGIYAFGELNFGRVSFHAGIGGYLYKGPGAARKFDLSENCDDNDAFGINYGSLEEQPWIFEKVGFRVEVDKNRNHFIGIYVRAHAPVIDFLGFQYGYKFVTFKNRKKN